MNSIRPKTDYEIIKSVVTYSFNIIQNIIVIIMSLFMAAGLKVLNILMLISIIAVIIIVVDIASVFKENLELFSDKLEQYTFSGVSALSVVSFEYLSGNLSYLQRLKIPLIYKFCIFILVIILMAVVNLIKNIVINKVYKSHMNDKEYIWKCKKFSDIMIRKTGKSRCPWCGGLSGIREKRLRGNEINQDRCMDCGRYAVPYNNVIEKILNPCIDIVILIMIIALPKYTLLLCMVYIIVKVFYSQFFRNYVPYKRINGRTKETRVWEDMLEEKFLCRAKIDFTMSLKKVFMFWDNRILIIIAVNEEGVAVSHPLCVRITKDKEEYRLTKIGDEVKFKSRDFNRFFVYLGDDKIGEGTATYV